MPSDKKKGGFKEQTDLEKPVGKGRFSMVCKRSLRSQKG
jgi:hypothetical protein